MHTLHFCFTVEMLQTFCRLTAPAWQGRVLECSAFPAWSPLLEEKAALQDGHILLHPWLRSAGLWLQGCLDRMRNLIPHFRTEHAATFVSVPISFHAQGERFPAFLAALHTAALHVAATTHPCALGQSSSWCCSGASSSKG